MVNKPFFKKEEGKSGARLDQLQNDCDTEEKKIAKAKKAILEYKRDLENHRQDTEKVKEEIDRYTTELQRMD